MSAAEGAAVRAARRSDARVIAAQWGQLIEEHAHIADAFALWTGVGTALERQIARAFADDDAALWVGERGDRVVAFCAAHVARPAPPAMERGRLELTELFVAEDARRCGFGRALVAAACEWGRVRGAERVEVRVAAGNAAGQAFWRSLGFNAFVDVLDRRL